MLHQAPGKGTNVSNFIPVDFVVNSIISVVVYQANKNSLLICHSAMPSSYKLTHQLVINSIQDFSVKNPFD